VPQAKKQAKKKTGIDDIAALTPFVRDLSKGSLSRHSLYTLCIRASLSKCFEFNLALGEIAQSEHSFFAMASLRGICEDLIVLNYLKKMPYEERETLLKALMGEEIATRSKLQEAFFLTIRPQQPVFRLNEAERLAESNASAARDVWNRHGWPNLNKSAMPQIRQIAEKQGLHQLATLYDYLYRLTSAAVHFNVQSLLRTGWGKSPRDFVFSTKNFHGYFHAYCSFYGVFMLCLYFEFFNSTLRPTAKVKSSIAKMREGILLKPRWPEMITFEEMNLKVPQTGTLHFIASAAQAASRRRLISKGVNYRNKRSSERQLLRLLGKILTGDHKATKRHISTSGRRAKTLHKN
jgi:hypothetical protein